MTITRIQAVIAFILMASAVAGAHLWRPTVHLADSRPKVELEGLFPKSFGSWSMDERVPVQLVSPDTEAMLNKIYNQTLSRTYVNRDGDRIMLSVAYGGDQSDGTRAHRPEVCYPAQGFQIMSSQIGVLAGVGSGLRVKQLVAKQGGRIEPITYWVTVGEQTVISGTEQKLAQLRYGVRGVVPDGMLVRVSSIDNVEANAYQKHTRFIEELAAAIPVGNRTLVLGNAGLTGVATVGANLTR